MMRTIWGAAMIGGGLYWASRQPGGIPGTWERLKQAVSEIKGGADPMATGRRFVRGELPATSINDPALQG